MGFAPLILQHSMRVLALLSAVSLSAAAPFAQSEDADAPAVVPSVVPTRVVVGDVPATIQVVQTEEADAPVLDIPAVLDSEEPEVPAPEESSTPETPVVPVIPVVTVVPDPEPEAPPTACKNPRVRREWRSLSDAEKAEYISAVKCLMNAEPTGTRYFPAISNRYEDFVAMHVNATGGGIVNSQRAITMGGSRGIHGAGVFYPWHRYVVWHFEEALRNECNYTGAQPYWDWHLDSSDGGGGWADSPIFDPKTGFGGNGVRDEDESSGFGWGRAFGGFFSSGGSGGGCVRDGPFKDIELHLGPQSNTRAGTERCLSRNFVATSAERYATKANIARTLRISNYASFRSSSEGSSMLHNVGHGGVGGEMMDVFSSPNDPLFWLHHCQMDRIWALWQSLDPRRQNDMAGTSSRPTTLDTMLWMGFNAPDVPIRAVMDTVNQGGDGILCYKYDVGAEEYLDEL